MSSWKVCPVDPDGREWDELLSSTRHLIFHEPVWARIVRDGFNAEPVTLLLKRDGATAGGMIGYTIEVFGVRSLYFGLPYGGVLAGGPQGKDLANLLTTFARNKRVSQVVLTPFPELGPEPGDAFSIKPLNTYLLRLAGRDQEAVWNGYKANVRRNIRRAERSGVEVEVGHTRDDLRDFYALYLAAMKRNRAMPKYGRSFVQAIGDHLLQQDRGALFLARHSGERVAGILVVDSEDGSHYLMGGSDPEALRHRPNELLFHAAIQRATERHYAFFDFLPSGTDHESLERFKQKWGCQTLPANAYHLVTRPLPFKLWTIARRLGETSLAREVLYKIRG